MMSVRPEVHAFSQLGPLPDETADETRVAAFQTRLEEIRPPLSEQEAELLVDSFGTDDCFGLAWRLLHLIETAPQLPFRMPPAPTDNEWRRRIWERSLPNNHDRYFEKLLKSTRTFLNRWKGADALMRELTVSHRTLRIVLSRRDQPGNLSIACIDPVRLAGPVHWSNSDIVISRAPLPGQSEDGFVVRDAAAAVEILCGKIEIAENVKL